MSSIASNPMKALARLCLLPLLVGSCFGLGVGLTEDQARNQSDIIAHVLITGTTPRSSASPIAPSPEAAATLPPVLDRFQRIASARVLTPVKGCKAGDTLALLFDNGYGCPNVYYVTQEECLVFLKKDPDGFYITMNLYCGRFQVKDGQVKSFYLLAPPYPRAPRTSSTSDMSLPFVIDWLLSPSTSIPAPSAGTPPPSPAKGEPSE